MDRVGFEPTTSAYSMKAAPICYLTGHVGKASCSVQIPPAPSFSCNSWFRQTGTKRKPAHYADFSSYVLDAVHGSSVTCPSFFTSNKSAES
jgi:hypothetical protein